MPVIPVANDLTIDYRMSDAGNVQIVERVGASAVHLVTILGAADWADWSFDTEI